MKLIPDDSPGVMEAKWAAMRFTPFLVIDPREDSAPLPQDAEEYIARIRVVAIVACYICVLSYMCPQAVCCGKYS